MNRRHLNLSVAGTALVAILIASQRSDLRSQAHTGKAPANRRNFVTCPIVRDTATLPCWLAEYNGELYYLGSQGSSGSAFYPPQLGHEVLVEGAIVEGPRICGAVPLNPVRVSVVTEINRACNTVLPAEQAFTSAPSPLAATPKFADTTREFLVPYDFDSDYLTLHTSRLVLEAVRIAKATNASKVDVKAMRGATLLSNGSVLVEKIAIVEARARHMGEHITTLGIPADRVSVTWQREPETPDGIADPQHRNVVITLQP
jgi:hypothetical protein